MPCYAFGAAVRKYEPWSRFEHTVVRDERRSEPNGGGGDPTVAVVDLATQRMSDRPATLAQPAGCEHVRDGSHQ